MVKNCLHRIPSCDSGLIRLISLRSIIVIGEFFFFLLRPHKLVDVIRGTHSTIEQLRLSEYVPDSDVCLTTQQSFEGEGPVRVTV